VSPRPDRRRQRRQRRNATLGLRKTGTGWKITHEHASTPFYMDGSGRAATDLQPEAGNA
jgi:ketosteroid isomerase-like protein